MSTIKTMRHTSKLKMQRQVIVTEIVRNLSLVADSTADIDGRRIAGRFQTISVGSAISATAIHMKSSTAATRVAYTSDCRWPKWRDPKIIEITSRNHLAGLIWPEVANNDFQQNRCSRSLPFSVIYHKTAERNVQHLRNSIQRRCQACQTTHVRNFENLL
ncbi:hypothetical protein TNCV_412921 [Trichonephila clavipes]|nr:hypothetical protein TNCV_412921 [Trichonephila clavipes]